MTLSLTHSHTDCLTDRSTYLLTLALAYLLQLLFVYFLKTFLETESLKYTLLTCCLTDTLVYSLTYLSTDSLTVNHWLILILTYFLIYCLIYRLTVWLCHGITDLLSYLPFYFFFLLTWRTDWPYDVLLDLMNSNDNSSLWRTIYISFYPIAVAHWQFHTTERTII